MLPLSSQSTSKYRGVWVGFTRFDKMTRIFRFISLVQISVGLSKASRAASIRTASACQQAVNLAVGSTAAPFPTGVPCSWGLLRDRGVPSQAETGRLILSSHRGGCRAIAAMLDSSGLSEPVNEMYLLDRLCGENDKYIA